MGGISVLKFWRHHHPLLRCCPVHIPPEVLDLPFTPPPPPLPAYLWREPLWQVSSSSVAFPIVEGMNTPACVSGQTSPGLNRLVSEWPQEVYVFGVGGCTTPHNAEDLLCVLSRMWRGEGPLASPSPPQLSLLGSLQLTLLPSVGVVRLQGG